MRKAEELSYQGAEAFEVVEGLAAYNLGGFTVVSLGCEVKDIGQALQGVVDLVCEFVRHGSLSDEACPLHEELLLTELADSDGGEVGEDLHDANVALVEGLFAVVREDVDGSACFVGLPGKHESIGDEGGCDSEDVEVARDGAGVLGASALETDAAPAGIVGEYCVIHAGIPASDGDPLVVRIFGAVLLLDADGRAVCAAELDGGLDQDLQDGLGLLDQGVGDAAHALGDYGDVACTHEPRSKCNIRLEVAYFQPGISR